MAMVALGGITEVIGLRTNGLRAKARGGTIAVPVGLRAKAGEETSGGRMLLVTPNGTNGINAKQMMVPLKR